MDSGSDSPAPATGKRASPGPETASAAPAREPRPDPRLEDLIASFAMLEQIPDPLDRATAKLREAKRLRIPERRYVALFEIYVQKRVPGFLLDPQLKRLVDWFARLSLFKLLEYVGPLAILLAIVSFFAECPRRRRQAPVAHLFVIPSAQ